MLVNIPVNGLTLEASLEIPEEAGGIVIFAHGSGSSRHSVRNNFVAQMLRKEGLATLLMDLLSEREDLSYEKRFDIDLLSERLKLATEWIKEHPDTKHLFIAYFGASTGAAAALNAAAMLGEEVKAVVSRGGRPDLSIPNLDRVTAPTFLIVGEADTEVIKLNEYALDKLVCEKELTLVPDATHLFIEEGTLEIVAQKAAQWFKKHLK